MQDLIQSLFRDDFLIQAVLSKPSKKGQDAKITIVPLSIKGQKVFQFTRFALPKAFHENHDPKDAQAALQRYLEFFKEAHFYTKEADILAMKAKTGEWRLIKSKSSKAQEVKTHNRLKQYALDEAGHAAFWKALGIANASGKIKPDRQAKFRQVNRFLEIVSDVIPHFPADQTLNIIDFGCGKAYLTFALYHYLVDVLKRSVSMVGIDLKQDVVNHLEGIRKALGFDCLQFYVGDIKTFPLPKERIDLVVSLHACDTATDHVLNRSIQAGVEVILAVPCCQHAFYSKIKQPALAPILKHGILKERFAALATDAARAAHLENSGYAVKVIEFIDTEHTPKNLMLKAIKSEAFPKPTSAQEFNDFLSYLSLSSLI
jgi:SAM-dependent methyltransferase